MIAIQAVVVKQNFEKKEDNKSAPRFSNLLPNFQEIK